jgi:formylglycine-generating enzyme required for sulfatase activity
VLRVDVPTCQVTRAGLVDVPAGAFVRGGPGQPPSADWAVNPVRIERHRLTLPAFAIDRTEVTNAAFARFAALAPVTGVAMPDYFFSQSLEHAGEPAMPVSGITWSEARAYCRFLGKELPTTEEWEKAMRGGVELPDGHPNPAPDRNLPWGTAPATLANVRDTGGNQPAPVASFAGDVSPYGVVDLGGNVQEWTESMQVLEGRSSPSWRITRGGNWGDATAADLVEFVALENSRPVGTRHFGTGVRCVLAGVTP